MPDPTSTAMSEYRQLLMRSNRLLGSALVEHNLVKFEDLETANERVLDLAAQGDLRQASVLGILALEQRVLREEDVLHTVMEEHGVGIVDLHNYDVPDEVKREVVPGMCWATWTVPYDKEEEFWFVATAYYLSPAVRTHWENTLGGPIVWQATSMEVIGEFLERLQAEREEHAKAQPGARLAGGTRVPFAGTRPPFAPPVASSRTPFIPPAGSRVPFPPPAVSSAPPAPPAP